MSVNIREVTAVPGKWAPLLPEHVPVAAGSRIRQASPHLLQLSQEGSKQMVGPWCLNVLSASTPKASFFVPFFSKHEQLQEFQDLVQNEDLNLATPPPSGTLLASSGEVCECMTLALLRSPHQPLASGQHWEAELVKFTSALAQHQHMGALEHITAELTHASRSPGESLPSGAAGVGAESPLAACSQPEPRRPPTLCLWPSLS
ncbi:unnamed protein product [Rangifer tarandus platyrhynchus]|uniref:Uncharacterized protein n=1 Tax=Rangifer tarandus platyrhynchus TaxID=3082113 RepID=A0AC59Y912_RANTA